MKKYLIFSLLTLSLSIVFSFSSPPANAVIASDWKAGNIIDDPLFTDKNSMSVDQIQTFLNNKVGTGTNGTPGQCDSYGVKVSELGGGTRSEYGATHDNPAPFTCLKDYYEVPKTEPGPETPENNYGGKPIPSGAKSAAQIIWDAAQTYNISPKVLLVKLGTESAGPLTSDDWPFLRQYTYAMGSHCPDSGPGGSANCDTDYAGFSIQMYSAASLLRWYLDNMTESWWPYKKPYQTNSILWNIKESGCGEADVYIENLATAALYTYTPYQPNQAALNNMYGLGDGCSAYGNRNFWRTFNDWFDPYKTVKSGVTMNIISQPDSTPARGQDVSYTVSFTNNLTYDVVLDAVGIVGRFGDIYNGSNRDFGWQGPVTLQPGVAQQFTFTTTIKDIGMIYAWPAVNYSGRYIHYNNWGTAMNSHQANLTLSTPLSMSPSNPIAGQTVTLSASVKNNEEYPIRIDSVGIPIRYYGRYNYDVAWTTLAGATIAPGTTQDLSGSRIFDKAGPYTAWVSWNMKGQYTSLSQVASYNITSPSPNFTLTYTETPNPTPSLGEDIVLKFKLKNNLPVPMTLNAVGVVGRYNSPFSGTNRDFGWIGPESFAANEEKSYTTFVSTVSKLDKFYAWVAINHNERYVHYNNWGFMMVPHKPNISVLSPLTVSPFNPSPGQSITATITLKNNEQRPIHYEKLGIPIRYYGVYNYDAIWEGPGTLSASGQTGDTISLSGNINLDKSGPYNIWTSLNIKGTYINIGDQKELYL